jgi:pyrimidine-nucleoside phosphorylase
MVSLLMDPIQTIARKRDGGALTKEQIATFVHGYTNGDIPDYQMAALAMAICLRGMDSQETAALTDAMLFSGTVLSKSVDSPPHVDKHSTGGIGDKVSVVLAPLLACCGVRVPMISGRGLGTTGGTLDKLESIPGYRTDLSIQEIRDTVERVGCVISGATAEIAPADKKLYALRDVTATVASIPLITASIMSKKLAENLDALVFDVKCGSGAVMASLDDARSLAQSLVGTGSRLGVKTVAILSDMNQPLGRMIGNAVEIDEAVDVLRGNGPDDLRSLTLALAAELLVLEGVSGTIGESTTRLLSQIDSGAALEKLREMVAAQGGDLNAARERSTATDWCSAQAGFVTKINAGMLGRILIQLGGGRRVLTDRIDRSVGLEMRVRLGDEVQVGQSLVRVFAPRDQFHRIETMLAEAILIGQPPSAINPLILERVEA